MTTLDPPIKNETDARRHSDDGPPADSTAVHSVRRRPARRSSSGGTVAVLVTSRHGQMTHSPSRARHRRRSSSHRGSNMLRSCPYVRGVAKRVRRETTDSSGKPVFGVVMLYIYPVDPNLFEKRRQIRF